MPGNPTNSSWSPDETPEQLFVEKSWLQGEVLLAVGYGAVLTLFPMCFYLLWKQRKSNPRQKIVLLVYITSVFILDTLFFASTTEFTQLSFIDYRNYPGGPAQFEQDMFSITADEISNVSYVIANWLSDAIIVWRCYVIFNQYSAESNKIWLVMAVPFLIFLGSIVTGIMFLKQISSTSPYVTGSVNWTTPYFSISLGLNIACTLAIVSRIMLFRRRIKRALGPDYGRQYLTVASMMVESAMIYTIYSLLFLVPFVLNHPISAVFLQSLAPVQTVSSLLIVFRVARGKAWDPTIATTNVTRPSLTQNSKTRTHASGASAPHTIPMSMLRSGRPTTQEVESVYDDNFAKTLPVGVLVERQTFTHTSGKESSVSEV